MVFIDICTAYVSVDIIIYLFSTTKEEISNLMEIADKTKDGWDYFKIYTF